MRNRGTFTDTEIEIQNLEWDWEQTARDGLLTPALERRFRRDAARLLERRDQEEQERFVRTEWASKRARR